MNGRRSDEDCGEPVYGIGNMMATAVAPAWLDSMLAAALFAVDPAALGGIAVRSPVGPVRERWLATLYALLPPQAPIVRMPAQVGDDRLLGGLDLAATLQAGRPIAERGLLAQADGGCLLIPMADRMGLAQAARLTAALDAGAVVVERDGLGLRDATRFGVVALDEGLADVERLPPAFLDRLAFHIDLSTVGMRETCEAPIEPGDVAQARELLPAVQVSDQAIVALCEVAMALGISSLRAPMLALMAARAAAALDGRETVCDDDVTLAARLVLMPRAICLPQSDEPAPPPPPEEPPPEETPNDNEDKETEIPDKPLSEVVLDATRAAMPANLLAQLRMGRGPRQRSRTQGRSGQVRNTQLRGRPVGSRRGKPRAGVRVNVIETLRAAAPWQPLRRAERSGDRADARLEIRGDDFRVTRYKQRTQTTAIFVVDASGSQALHRLAEAKGAVEYLLADCYVRRDRVALISFRGAGAELLLPPTRSLVRAKRSLAGLPGGGGTPLAAGIDAAFALADAVRRSGDTPLLVLLTDGRANVSQDPALGRAAAEQEALVAARRVAAASFSALVIDTSPRPARKAEELAREMDARYMPLPHADAALLSKAILAQVP